MSAGLFDGVLYGAKDTVVPFVGKRIPHVGASGFGPFPYSSAEALGVVRDGELIGGAVFHNWQGHDIQVSIAFDDPRWMRRRILRRLFAYPFVTLGCTRLTALTAADAGHVRRLLEGLGFTLEGRHPRGLGPDTDAVSYGLLSDDCRWLRS